MPDGGNKRMVAWLCRKCGLGLICDDEPGYCGCTTTDDGWTYERVEVVPSVSGEPAPSEEWRCKLCGALESRGGCEHDFELHYEELAPGEAPEPSEALTPEEAKAAIEALEESVLHTDREGDGMYAYRPDCPACRAVKKLRAAAAEGER